MTKLGYPSFPEPQDIVNPHEQPDEFGTYSSEETGNELRKFYVTESMKIVNAIPGVEFESFEDWMAHVEKILVRIHKG